MLQQYKITPYAIIVALAAVLIIPMKGNAQTKYNKFTSKGKNINNPASKQKQLKNHRASCRIQQNFLLRFRH